MNALRPPYPLIKRGLSKGRVIPFLGAGASLGVRLVNAGPNGGTDDSLPSGSELAAQLAHEGSFPETEERNLASVAQYYQDVAAGRTELYEQLRAIFVREYEPARIHRYLAALPSPLLVVTTNYDDLIETAFRAAGRPYDLVVHTVEPGFGERLLWWEHEAAEPVEVVANKLDVDLDAVTVIYKMHGAVDRVLAERDQYVITEDDYVDFLTRLTKKEAVPAIFAEPFLTRHFLFLGYGLRDWNLRVILNRVDRDLRDKTQSDLRSWAIDANPSILETRLWQGRGVEIYQMTIDGFLDGLDAA